MRGAAVAPRPLFGYNFPMLLKKILFPLLVPTLLLSETLLQKLGQKAFLANINTFLIFTSQDALTTGKYRFKHTGMTMDVANLPFIYHLEGSKSFNWFLTGNGGYSRVYLSEATGRAEDTFLVLDDQLQTYTAGLGFGGRYTIEEDLALLAGVELIYSRAGVSVKSPRLIDESVVKDFFDSNYNDNITYKLLTALEYRPTLLQGYKPYMIAHYKIFDTKSDFTFESLSKLHSQSRTLLLGTGVETPPLYTLGKNGTDFEKKS